MTQIALAELEDNILKASRSSSVGQHVKGVHVETDSIDEGDEFLRIVIQLDTFENLKDNDTNLLRRIETSVIEIDDRFPSVRFSDAG